MNIEASYQKWLVKTIICNLMVTFNSIEIELSRITIVWLNVNDNRKMCDMNVIIFLMKKISKQI